jgi:DNA-binding MarR family transcriptional regulator
MSHTLNSNDPHSLLQHALWRVLRSLVFRGDPDSPLNDLPLSQLKCLHIVGEQEGQRMVDVAHRMEIKLPALSQIVDRLVKRGLLARQPDLQDRRVVRLGLTESARALHAEANAKRQARMAATAGNLDAEAVERVAEGLTLLAVAAEQVEAQERQSAPSSLSEPDPLAQMISARSRPHAAAVGVSPPSPTGRQ